MHAFKVSSTAPEATRSIFFVEVDVVPPPDDPIISSLAHPPTSIPNNAITPNVLTDRSAMVRPLQFLVRTICLRASHPTPDAGEQQGGNLSILPSRAPRSGAGWHVFSPRNEKRFPTPLFPVLTRSSHGPHSVTCCIRRHSLIVAG